MTRPFRFLVLLLCGLLSLAATAAGVAASERRVALVIGNSAYKSPGLEIPNARNDAQDTASALKALGFDVLLATDVDLAGASKAIQQFARMSIGADATLFYFAGHAVQYQGQNYLLPVDAEVRDEISLPFETIAVDNIRSALDRSNGVKIMVLDACRTNPVSERLARLASAAPSFSSAFDAGERTRGLQRIDKSDGLVVAFSTSPGDVALDGQDRNSPFTRAFLRRLNEPGLEIETMFRRIAADVSAATGGRQRPETYVSLVSEYYLNQDDSLAWDRIKGTDDPEVLNDFIERYPSSYYAIAARYRLEALQRAIEAARAQALREADLARREKELAAQRAQAEAAKAACERDATALQAIAPADAPALRGFVASASCGAVQAAASARLSDLEARIAADAALCQNEDNDLKALVAKGDAAAISALRADARCPATNAAAEQGLRAIAAAADAACGAANATLNGIGARDVAALRALIDKAPCAIVASAAAQRLAEGVAAIAQEAQACRRDQAAWKDLASSSDRAAIAAFRQRAACPDVIAAIDQAEDEFKTACAAEQGALAAIGANDAEATRAFLANAICDDAKTAARAKIAAIAAAAARLEDACAREDAELAGLKSQGAGARGKLIDLKGRLTCGRLRPDLEAALEQIAPQPAPSAAAPPQTPAARLLRRPRTNDLARPAPQPAPQRAAEPKPAKPARPAAVAAPARVARPVQPDRPPPAQSTAQSAPNRPDRPASPLGVGF